ncbi:MAG: tetratricopeptide repeat protein [Anaerolineae bacterium]|nr:tetratricopeptide repeat protein [Anaerolineae bacterium]
MADEPQTTYNGPVAADGGDAIDTRGSQGTVVKPSGPVTQYFNTIYNFIDDKFIKRLGLGQRVGFMLLAILIIGMGISLYFLLRPRQPTQMVGDFRIAVAGFVVQGSAEELDVEVGEEFAYGVYLHLVQTFSEFPGIVVWGPDKVDRVKGNEAASRAISANEIAQKLDADMIIYGVVDIADLGWTVTPEFYVTAENFHQAQEVTGQHELGTPVVIKGRGNPADRRNVSTELAARTQVLSYIAIGLADYANHDYEQALASFQSAEQVPDWEDDEGKQVLYLLSGNAAGRVGDLALAESYHTKSLALDPEYARAYVGLAGVHYMQALKPYEETNDPTETDITFLEQSIATYKTALDAKHQPALSDISTKVHFGLGQCHFALVYSGNATYFDAAIGEFKQVIDTYADGANPRIREITAESYARLALIYDLSGYPDLASEHYQEAANLLWDDVERQALYEARARTVTLESSNP